MRTRVMVFARVDEQRTAEFEAAYAQVTRKVAGTPGHIRDELLRDTDNPGSYVLLSEWVSAEHFLAWENAPVHRELTVPMRPYWTGRVDRKIFDVAGSSSQNTD
jgi:heme oxygenase (mycobilin-producing)